VWPFAALPLTLPYIDIDDFKAVFVRGSSGGCRNAILPSA